MNQDTAPISQDTMPQLYPASDQYIPDTPVLCAYGLDKSVKDPTLRTQADILSHLEKRKLVWVHIDANHPDAAQWMKTYLKWMDDIQISALLAPETRPRVTQYKEGSLLFLRGVNLNADAKVEDMVSIRLWMDEGCLITTRLRKLKAVQELRHHIVAGMGPHSTADFICRLTSGLFTRMQPVIQDLFDDMDDIEGDLIEDADPDPKSRQKLSLLRKKTLMLRRYIAPQREAMTILHAMDLPWLDPISRRHLQEGADHLSRYVEDLDVIHDRASLVKEEISSILSDQMNRNMYALSIIAGIFLPLGFITGLLGINVGGMPGVENDLAFWIVCALCTAFALGTIGLFRLFKWL